MKLSSYTITLFSLICGFQRVLSFQPDSSTQSSYKAAVDQLLQEQKALAIPAVDPGPPNYWYHPKIHTFGNHGPLGAFHATVAPIATKMIDVFAYEGENVRDQLACELYQKLDKPHARIADLACGVGMSTRALSSAFPSATKLIGIDTSPEMIRMANAYTNPESLASKAMGMIADILHQMNGIPLMPKKEDTEAPGTTAIEYKQANAENTGLETGVFDLVTIMYCFHEAPYHGRSRILKEANRLLAPGGTLAVVDISPSYEPSFSMLAGEPYVLEYKENIQAQLHDKDLGFCDCRYKEVVPGHVGLWLLEREYDETVGAFE